MISLTAANVSLTPAQRKQLLSRLKRSIRLGERLGDFLLKINIRRTGRHVEVTADGHNRFGDFHCRAKQMTLGDAVRMLTRLVLQRLHAHSLERAMLRMA